MRHRIGQPTGTSQGGMSGLAPSTGWRTRLLRAHHMDANLPPGFSDPRAARTSYACSNALIKAMNLDEKQWPPRQAMRYINTQRDEGDCIQASYSKLR